MNVTLNAADLERTTAEMEKYGERLRKKLWAVVRKLGFDTERKVKRAMPVDTGRARASFGQWDDHVNLGKHPKWAASRQQVAMASEQDSIHLEEEQDLRVTVGSNLPYIEVLNEGHSGQAPAGFIDVIADEAGRLLEKAVVEAINAV